MAESGGKFDDNCVDCVVGFGLVLGVAAMPLFDIGQGAFDRAPVVVASHDVPSAAHSKSADLRQLFEGLGREEDFVTKVTDHIGFLTVAAFKSEDAG